MYRDIVLLRSDGHDLAKHQLGGGSAVAQEFATRFYHTRSWRQASKSYMNVPVDLSGNVVYDIDGRYCRIDGDGEYVPVAQDMVVPPGLCERCFAMGAFSPAKLVHHKTHLTPENIDDPGVSLDYDNFQRLCQDCHAIVHSNQQESRTVFNADGTEERSAADSFEAHVMRLTATESERRNIHKGDGR